MGSSESTSVPNPNHEGSEVGFQSSQSPQPNPDLDDHAPSDPNRTAREEEKEEEEHKLLEQLEKLDLRDESEVESKVEVREDEKDWNLDLNEAEKAKSDSNVEEEEEENENEEKRGDSEWSYGYDNDNENVNEVEIGIDKEVIESGSGSEVDKKGERNGGNGRRFQSQYPVRPEAEDCPFYLKTGMCKFGTHCKFNHPVKRKIQVYIYYTIQLYAYIYIHVYVSMIVFICLNCCFSKRVRWICVVDVWNFVFVCGGKCYGVESYDGFVRRNVYWFGDENGVAVEGKCGRL